jgi:heme-degrading monooxygenase HmoA
VRSVQPQVPGFEEHILARDQTEYAQLPAVFTEVESIPCVVTRWTFTPEERAAVAAGADLWLEMLTFGERANPVKLGVECPLLPAGEPS